MSHEPVDILLVEDDQRLADLTARYLRQNGFTVVVESHGDHAITRFHEERPRIVLLDWMLPGKDGLAICRELRKTFQGPILIITAKDSDIDQVDPVLSVQIARKQQGQVENACPVCGRVGDFGL